ncbi:putative reverse transcriptase domain-containing protein [Tanacetum coccineum]
MDHQTSSVPQIAYHSPQVSTQPMNEFPQLDSGLVVLVFIQGDDPIACLNMEMAFLLAVAALRFPSTNNQLTTSFNPRNQATIQDDRGNATSSRGNNVGGLARVVKCYNCQGEGHMARQCTQPKRPRNAAWFKEKAMLAEAQESGQILDEEQLAFLADPGILDGQASQTTIPNNAAFQTEDLDAYDSDCDDDSNAKAILMANLSNYGSDVILEVPHSEPYHHDMDNQSVHAIVEASSELPKVSLVNTSLKKLKIYLSKFDTVVKKRITPDAITEGEWGFEHTKAVFLNAIIPFLTTLKDIFNVSARDILNEVTEVQTVFNQMEAAVQQCSVDKQCFKILKKELFLENDRLLQQIMSQDVLLSVMNSTTLNGEYVNLEMQNLVISVLILMLSF